MQRVIPTLRITDLAQATRFYVDGLGFQIDWEHRFEPHFPVFMQITRDEYTLYLSQHTGDCQVGGLVYLYVADVDAWYRELTTSAVHVPAPPADQPWGNRDFRISDPDGNQLVICTRISNG